MDLGHDLRAVVFDFDGTLFDLTVDWDAVRRDLGIAGTGETVGDALQRLVSAGDPAVETVTRHEVEAVGDKRISPEIAQAVARVGKRHRIAVCTRNSRLAVERAFEDTPLASAAFVVGREDTTRLKPDPEGLELILREFQIEPGQAILVGDTFHDVEAAKAAGLRSVVVGNPRLAYRPDGADFYVDDIAELAAGLDDDGDR